jgi:hypothetical protein
MLYGRYTISLANINSTLNSMELRTRLNGKGSDDQAKGLFVNGRSKNSSNFKSRSNENDSVKVKQNQ